MHLDEMKVLLIHTPARLCLCHPRTQVQLFGLLLTFTYPTALWVQHMAVHLPPRKRGLKHHILC